MAKKGDRIGELVATAPSRLIQFGKPEGPRATQQVATKLTDNDMDRLKLWAQSLGCRPSQLLAAAILDVMDSHEIGT